jgi:hypothetical protein
MINQPQKKWAANHKPEVLGGQLGMTRRTLKPFDPARVPAD